MNDALAHLLATPIIPVITLDDAAAGVPLARALYNGGLRVIEITFRTDAAPEAVRRITAEVPEMAVAAGTLVTANQVREALAANVRLGFAPGLNPRTVAAFQEAGVPFVPGVATPSEIERALEIGCRTLKFFPAEPLGGVGYLRSIATPYETLGVRFCPTGGITRQNMADYLALPNVCAVGGSWLATRQQIAAGKWQEITAQVRHCLDDPQGRADAAVV